MSSFIKHNCLSTNNLNSPETHFFGQKKVIITIIWTKKLWKIKLSYWLILRQCFVSCFSMLRQSIVSRSGGYVDIQDHNAQVIEQETVENEDAGDSDTQEVTISREMSMPSFEFNCNMWYSKNYKSNLQEAKKGLIDP